MSSFPGLFRILTCSRRIDVSDWRRTEIPRDQIRNRSRSWEEVHEDRGSCPLCIRQTAIYGFSQLTHQVRGVSSSSCTALGSPLRADGCRLQRLSRDRQIVVAFWSAAGWTSSVARIAQGAVRLLRKSFDPSISYTLPFSATAHESHALPWRTNIQYDEKYFINWSNINPWRRYSTAMHIANHEIVLMLGLNGENNARAISTQVYRRGTSCFSAIHHTADVWRSR